MRKPLVRFIPWPISEFFSARIGRGIRVGVLSLLPPLGLACSPGMGADAGFSRQVLGDTIFFHNTGPVFSKSATLEEKLRIGLVEGPEEYLFGVIRSLAVSAEGEFFVAGGSQDGIRQFRRDGTFKRWVARDGEGPDEVRALFAVAVGPGGRVAATDLRSRSIKVLHPNRETLTIPLPWGPWRYQEDGLVFHSDGTLWVALPPPAGLQGPVQYPRAIFARISDDGELVDTIFAPDRLEEMCPWLEDVRYRSGVWVDKREQYFPIAEWTLGPAGEMAIGCPDTYVFDVLRPGEPVLRVSRDWEPVQVSEGEKKAIADRVVLRAGLLPLPPLPDTRPAYARILLPGDGRIWVWPVYPSREVLLPESQQNHAGTLTTWRVADNGAFDVFERDGRWLGKVQLNPEMEYTGYSNMDPDGVVIRGDTMWAVARDSLDVAYAVRYLVKWPKG